MTSKENYVTINSNKIVSKLNDVFIGDDNKDILNINSKLLLGGVENTLLPKPNKNDKGKLVKLNNTGDDYDLVELKENNTRVHKICNMVQGEDNNTDVLPHYWTDIKPVDGDLILKKNEEVIYFINISGFQDLQNDTLLTWKLSYKIKGDTNYTDFADSNRDSDGTFSHNFDSINDHQHRAFQIYYKADNDIIIDTFKVSFLINGAYGNIDDFLSINALILSDGNAISKYITEYPLAGAGGTAAFTNAVSDIDAGYGSKDNLVDDKLYSNSGGGSLYLDQLCSLLKGGNAYWFYSVTFTTPQIVTKYRIWGRWDGSTSDQNPRNWEFRAATDSSTYNATDSTTYTVLDSQVLATFNSYTSTANASDNLGLGNVYNLSTIGAYKHYVLHITANGNNAGTGNHSTHCTMSEIALYSSYTLPSQIGNSGRQLITDGIKLGWGGPISNLNTTITADDKYKLVKLNEEGTLEYCSTDAIQLPSGNNLQRPLGIDGMIRYNNESDNMEVVENYSWKIVNTNNFNEASMGLINRAITDTSYDDDYNNSFGYYYHNRTLCPLYSEKLVYNVWHKLNFDKVFYDHSPNTNMINLLYNKIYVRETGEYLLTYSSAFKSTGGTDLNTKFKFRIYKNENSLVNSGDIHYESDEFQAIQTQIITNYGKFPLAGAGISTGFTASALHPLNSSGSYSISKLYDNSTAETGTGIFATSATNMLGGGSITFTEVAYEFDIPREVTKYRLWPRRGAGGSPIQNIRIWEFRGAINSTVYDANDDTTYTVLHTHNENTYLPAGKYTLSLASSTQTYVGNRIHPYYPDWFIINSNQQIISRSTDSGSTNLTAVTFSSDLTSFSATLTSQSMYGTSTYFTQQNNTNVYRAVQNGYSFYYTREDDYSSVWKTTELNAAQNAGNTTASSLLHLSNEYTIDIPGKFKYYVLHITSTFFTTPNHVAIGEFALYGNETKNHYFIPEFNHVLNLQQNDCITLYLNHNNNGSNSILLSYDYLGGQPGGLNYSRSNLYNYEYIKTIASKLCIRKILNN